MSSQRTSYVVKISEEQAEKLEAILRAKGWEFSEKPYAFWQAAGENAVVIPYRSGKLVVQGKGTQAFVQFVLEPEVLGSARFGYEHVLAEQERPEMFQPHGGVDESGKGDYFGPLVIAAVYVDGETARELLRADVKDSKKIKSDKMIQAVTEKIRGIVRGRFSLVTIGPEAYNRLYAKMGNLNRLLAWAHARAIENLLDKVPDCPRAVSDQFGNPKTVENALLQRGRKITLEQYPRAESDVAVAAASILARSEFVRRLDALSKEFGIKLPKGAGPAVIAAAEKIAVKQGVEGLRRAAKLHFRTTSQALGGAVP